MPARRLRFTRARSSIVVPLWETVRVLSNGTSRELRARLNRKLRTGVARVADEHAAGFEDRVQVEKLGA